LLLSIPSCGTGYAERVIEPRGEARARLAVIKDAEQIRSFIEGEVPPPPAIGAEEPQQMSRAALHMKSECWSSGH